MLNKNFLTKSRWLVTIILLLSFGISNAWGTVQSGWTRVTTTAEITAGGTFIIGYEATANSDVIIPLRSDGANATTSSEGYLYSGTTQGATTTGTINMSSIATTSPYELTIAASSVTDGAITIQMSTGNYIGAVPSKNKAKLYTSATTTNTDYTVAIGSNDVVTLTNVAGAATSVKDDKNYYYFKYLRYNTANNNQRFAHYRTGQADVVMYKKSDASCSDPAAPSNSSVSSTGATLSTSSSSADYQFFCSTSSSPASKTADYTVSGGQSVTISNLKYGTTYYYWARHDCGSSSYSNWVAGSPTSFTTSCPNSLSVSAGTLTTSGATFTITDNNSPTYISFNGSGYGYEIYYSTSIDTPESSPSGTVTTTSTSKSVTGLSAGQKYYYWVRGYGPNGKSSWVSGGNFTTLDLSSIAITTDPTKLAYIHGETFDKTGAVVTATYTNSTTANVSSSAVWTPSTALTTTGSNTITASYTENGTEKTTTIDVTVYGVTMQARDESGNTIPAAGPSSPTRTVTSITPQNDKGNYVWKEWSVSGASLGSSKETKSNSINTPTADITVTAVYWAPRNVVWMVNGSAYTTGSPTRTIAYNEEWKDLKLPTDPTPPCGDKFMGWTTTNIGSTGLDVDDDASEIADLDLMTSGNKSEKTGATGHYITDATVTFYAVFADYDE